MQNPVVIFNYGYIEFGRKFQIEYDDTLYNHDYLRIGMGSGADADLHFDGYICNTDTIEVDENGKFKIHGGRLDCGGVILACHIEYDNSGATKYAELIHVKIDTCNTDNPNYNCASTSYGPKNAADSVVIPDSSNISFCDGLGFDGFSLPVMLEYFSGSFITESNVVKLNWATQSEINNDYFTILRSIDLNIWETVADISAAENSRNRISYSFEDESPMSETSYYLLKQTDYDGAHSFSNIVAVNSKNDKFERIYPQPANDVLFLSFSTNYNNISILNSLGKVVYSDVVYDSNFIEIDVSDIPAGVYIVLLKSDTNEKSVKMVVQH